MRTSFEVEVTPDRQVLARITQERKPPERDLLIELTLDAGDALQMSYLLEAAAVEIQTREMGTRPS